MVLPSPRRSATSSSPAAMYEAGKGHILSHFQRMASPEDNNIRHGAGEDNERNHYDAMAPAASPFGGNNRANHHHGGQHGAEVALRKRRESASATTTFKYADFGAHLESARLEAENQLVSEGGLDNNADVDMDERGAGEGSVLDDAPNGSPLERKLSRQDQLREWKKNKREHGKGMQGGTQHQRVGATTNPRRSGTTTSSRLSTGSGRGRKSIDENTRMDMDTEMMDTSLGHTQDLSFSPPRRTPSSGRSTLEADHAIPSPRTPASLSQNSDARLHGSSGQRKRWKDNSALDASFCSDSYSPMRSAEFLNRDLEDEIRAMKSKSDKEKAYIYKKRYMDTYGFAVGLARHLEHLQRVQADRRDEIEVLKGKIKGQERIIDTIADHEDLDGNGHHSEKRIQALCREVAMMSRHLAERDGYIENLQHEREESVRTMNRLKLSHAACQSGNCASSTASQSYSSIGGNDEMHMADSMEVQALQERLAAAVREKDHAEAEVAAFKSQLSSLKSTCNRLTAERATCADAVKRGEEQMEALRGCFEQGKNDREMNGRRVAELTIERDELRARLDALQTDHRVSMENEKRYLSMLTSQHAAVDIARRRIQSLESELVDTKRRLSELNEKAQHVAQLDRELTQSKQELNSAKSRIHLLEQQARLVQKERDELEVHNREREMMLETRIYQGELVRRSLHNKVMELKGNIRVFCRVRPVLLHEEANCGEDIFVFPDYSGERRVIELQACPRSHQGYGQNGSKDTVKKYQFDFDMVFDGGCTQEELFLEVSALVQSALDGYNVCIFAYGQTGSGKTYTMQGVEEDPLNAVAHRGIVGRALSHIFASIADLRSSSWEFAVSLEMVEIYNETLRDLLAVPGSTDKVDLRLDAEGKPTVVNSCVHPVNDEFEALKLLQKAMTRRATKMTNMNDRSSRSHCVITLRLNGVNGLNGERRSGVVHLVDLAGSERLSKSGSGKDRETMKETQSINKSLSSLGNVIGALAKKSAHVPFRDSKLTHFLSPSLGGDSKTLMICNLSPLPQHRDESLNSLRFAKTANSCEIAFPSFSNRS